MIQWTDEAQADVDGFVRWLNERNPQAARKVAEDVLAGIEMLERFPLSGREGRRIGTRELIISKRPYVVVYRVGESAVVVLRVLHMAMQWPPQETQR